jgi:hypothetical protein
MVNNRGRIIMKRIISLGLIFAIVCGVAVICQPVNAVSDSIDSNINQMMVNIKKNSPEIMAMSSPYAYISNEYFNNIVTLGSDALPVIEEKLKSSNEEGLREQILAIAAEKIEKAYNT